MKVDSDLICVRHSGIHGSGVFAARDLPAGTRIVEYVGERIDKRESAHRCSQNNCYIFSLGEDFDLDGNVPWNVARFINHSCAPNCEAQLAEERIWIVTLRPIQGGEEITFNYSYDLEDYHDHPCRCGSLDCVGYIVAEAFFEEVRRKGSGRTSPVEVPLPPGASPGEKRAPECGLTPS